MTTDIKPLKSKIKRFTFNISVDQKNELIKASVQIISKTQSTITWYEVLTYLIDSYSNNVISDIDKFSKQSGKGILKSTYNITSDRRDRLIDIANESSTKLKIHISWHDVLTFMINTYLKKTINDLIKRS